MYHNYKLKKKNLPLPIYISGTEIVNLKKDTRIVGNDELSFKLTQQRLEVGHDQTDDRTEWVSLNPSTGVLSVNTPVDRERDCDGGDVSCVIKITVSYRKCRFFLTSS